MSNFAGLSAPCAFDLFRNTGRTHTTITTVAASILVSCVALAPVAFAADEPQVLRARAAQLASSDDCAAALPLLAQASEIDPAGDTEVALLKGRCLVSQKDFDAATPLLEQAVAADPNSGEAALALGISRYHQGNYSESQSELERAERMLPNRPEPPLYIGLILLNAENAAAAAAQLDRANNLNGDGFDPVSTYYGALAHAGAGNAERASASLQRVEELGAGTPYADRAREALANAEKRQQSGGALQRWVTLQAGLDYDSNVALRGDQVTRPGNIDGRDDGRGWWAVDLGADLFRKGAWSGGTGANYNGNAYFDSGDFNQDFVTGSFWLARTLGENTVLQITPEGGFGFLDGDEYLRFFGVRPELRHNFGDAGIGILRARYAYNDFRFDRGNLQPRPSDREDRDGHDYRLGYDHQLPVGEKTVLRGGIFGRHYTAEGAEYDYTGGGGWLGFTQSLPWKLTLDVTGSAAYDVYDDESQFLPSAASPLNTADREDLIGTAGVVLSRPITSWLSVAARWNYLNSDSNTAVFDYDRHIVGAFFTIGFAQPGGLFSGSNL